MLTALIFLSLLLMLFYLLLIVTGYRYLWAARELIVPIAAEPSGAPFVSIIVPARNEEDMIERCVTSLVQQNYSSFEVIVVNDNSTDRTGEILADLARRFPSLRVIHGQPLPVGWCGKPFALHQGRAHVGRVTGAAGHWLLFTDADTWHHPQMLSSVITFAQSRNVEMLSLMTDQEIVTFWEKVLQPIAIHFLVRFFPFDRVNDPDDPLAIANGQFILIQRDAYDRLGGHERVKGEVVEDLELARVAKRARVRFMVADGRALVKTRMYTGLRDAWQGWTKVAYTHRGMTLGKLAGGVLLTALLGLAPLALLLTAFVSRVPLFMAASAALFLVYCYHWAKINHILRVPVVYALTNPLGTALMIGMMLTSAVQVLSGRGVMWKGRRYGRMRHNP
ncbi:MAG: glycosyltransferase family 2 protein [Abditibacteriales bacterium]|nr:glycosyltransferase family 2 protein [Abditibacteriales bacterium]MDW8365650.1 glycosyltransferase family 2 protein [Abditibacteriales bacterium]